MIRAALAVILLSPLGMCATPSAITVSCPQLIPHSKAEEVAIGTEITALKLPKGDPLVGWATEYISARDQIRACHKAK